MFVVHRQKKRPQQRGALRVEEAHAVTELGAVVGRVWRDNKRDLVHLGSVEVNVPGAIFHSNEIPIDAEIHGGKIGRAHV